MMKLRSVTAGAIATAMLATSATPAMAQSYPGGVYGGGYGHDGYHHRDHDGIGAGGIIAGIAAIGIIAAIASSGHNSRNRYNDGYSRSRSDEGYSRGGTEGDAAAACAGAAEQRLGRDARVTTIDQVARTYEGYQVSGILETQGYRYNDQQRFTCQVRYGAVERIDFSGDNGYRGY